MCDQDYDLWDNNLFYYGKKNKNAEIKMRIPTYEDLINPRYIGACCDATILLLKGKLDYLIDDKDQDKKKLQN